MCVICADWQKLTRKEVYQNLSEVFDEENEHHQEIWIRLLREEISEEG